jgi:RNA polymerase sigma-70 factor (ECF subfamily)
MNDDNECMTRLAAGDAGALRELYQRHGRALLRFSCAMCHSRQAAEDMVHDTFVALLREPLNFDPALGSVFGYLCGVLRHRARPRRARPRGGDRALGNHGRLPARHARAAVAAP